MEYDLSTVPDFSGRPISTLLYGGPFGGSLTSLTPSSERLVKAKSDGSLAIGGAAGSSSPPVEQALGKLKSRSLEPLTGLAMWSSEPQVIELVKGDRGLGFSILDYQDPMNPNETVIVIRSLVPGGVAQQDGRLIPGDRLLFVNDINLENASLDSAVQALKGAAKGVVRIGVAKPLPLPESGQQISLESSPTYPDMKTTFELPLLPRLSLDFEQEKQNSVLPSTVQEINLMSTDSQNSPVRTIHIQKGENIFGLSVNIVDSVGVMVTSVTPGSACDRDGRLTGGEVVVSINNRSLVSVEPRTVGDVLRSVDKSSSDVIIQYIPADLSEESTSSPLPNLLSSLKSDEDESEYFTVSETEPLPVPPLNKTPTLVSEIPQSPLKYVDKESTNLEQQAVERVSPKLPSVQSKISPISLPSKPPITAPKPKIAVPAANVAPSKLLDVSSIVSKVKPTVPFKPTRTSLSPKDAFPPRTKPSPTTTVESVLGNESESPGCVGGRQWGAERTIILSRDPVKGLGISIISGRVDSVRGGIFIKNVLPDSPAGWDGTLKRGDRILEVSGMDIRNSGHAKAVDAIKNASNPVTFVIQSLVPLPQKTEIETYTATTSPSISPSEENTETVQKLPDTKEILPETMQHSRIPSMQSSHPPPVVERSDSSSKSHTKTEESSDDVRTRPATSDDAVALPAKSDDALPRPAVVPTVPSTGDRPKTSSFKISTTEEEEDEVVDLIPLAEGKVWSKKGKQIDMKSAANVKLLPSEKSADHEPEDEFGYTQKKVQKKYGDMRGDLIFVNIVKGSNKLGLSLAGNKDRTKMSVFVCGMHPKGMAAKDGRVNIGDELLEVNGVVVYGRCHLNASAMIKSLSGTAYKILLLRREGAIEEMAVKPLSQFPSELDEEATEDKYWHYRGMHTVTVRKGAQGLGIMIIEGKHVEVGQGIFISDIQEHSPAKQAGLNVGDMILAANDADLVGADYDTAASLLKQADGLLTLIVATPNKPTLGCIYEEEKKCAEIIEKSFEKNKTIKTCEKKKDKKDSELPPLLDPKKCEIRAGRETTLEITKEKMGLGLSIVGGCDTPLSTVIIHEVYPDGAAALDGRLRPGDQILEVNGEDLRDALHEHAIAVLRQTSTVVQMLVYREEGQTHEEDAFETLDVELHKKAGKGLGLSIVGRKNGPGVFISEVVKGGIAEADGRLIQGDQIIEVNGQDLKTASQEHAAAVLKTTMGRIHMKIGRLKAGSRRSTSCLTTTPKIQENIDSSGPAELKTITLERGSTGLGFSVIGGHGSPHGDLPIYVKKVFDDGAAARDGQLNPGDQIVCVNDRSLDGLTHEEAVDVLKRVTGTVVLQVLS